MRKIRKTLARGLATGLALMLALESSGATAHMAPQGDFEQLIAEADGHADAQRHSEALDTYIQAFEAMPDELKASEVGEFVTLAAAKSAMAAYEEARDAVALVRGRTVLTQFIEVASDAEVPVDAAEARLAELEAMMPADSDTGERPPPPEQGTEPVPVSSPPPTRDAAPNRRPLAIGLVVGGGVAAVAGVSLMVVGTRQVPWYQQRLEEQGWTPDSMGYDEQIAEARRIRNIDIGVGVALLAVGVGLGVGGGVLLARSRRGGGSRAWLAPSLRRDGAGLSARVRF